ncbi:uncharacterized protein LOC111642490 [Centruroides sculpturatus]|uniref:uncharacterized protein LOC111642489 n=1 Tax=Centruroides sculpturatus TaxID=218467 RepID=UPI000C6D0DF2|nr:uncharacterized protein LOC111642489 [Centruroides sculpturatus]XP_023244612.1 uncharacterized protein LOC111642490 [Centruroides sculpturatus]
MTSTNAHFLDINIMLNGESIDTGIYYKPSYIPWFIPANSADPYTYKIAAFRALIRRAFTHPSKWSDTIIELQNIERVAVAHGYRKELVQRMANAYLRARETQEAPVTKNDNQEPNRRRNIVEYSKRFQALYKEIATKTNTRIAYRRTPNVYQLLRNAKDKQNDMRAPGVYSIPVRDDRFKQERVYIGSTKRSIQQRVKEHKYDIEHARYTTALSTYATDPDIHAELSKARLINRAFHTDHIRALEALEIYKAGRTGRCINNKDGNTLSYAWRYVCEEQQKR